MGATGGRDTLLSAILDQLRILRGKISAAGIGDLLPGHIIIGDHTSTNETMELIDQIDFQIDIEDGVEYVLSLNNAQKGELISLTMELDAGTADVTLNNEGSDVSTINPAAVTDTETVFDIDSNDDFAVGNKLMLSATTIVGAETLYGSLKILVLP